MAKGEKVLYKVLVGLYPELTPDSVPTTSPILLSLSLPDEHVPENVADSRTPSLGLPHYTKTGHVHHTLALLTVNVTLGVGFNNVSRISENSIVFMFQGVCEFFLAKSISSNNKLFRSYIAISYITLLSEQETREQESVTQEMPQRVACRLVAGGAGGHLVCLVL